MIMYFIFIWLYISFSFLQNRKTGSIWDVVSSSFYKTQNWNFFQTFDFYGFGRSNYEWKECVENIHNIFNEITPRYSHYVQNALTHAFEATIDTALYIQIYERCLTYLVQISRSRNHILNMYPFVYNCVHISEKKIRMHGDK